MAVRMHTVRTRGARATRRVDGGLVAARANVVASERPRHACIVCRRTARCERHACAAERREPTARRLSRRVRVLCERPPSRGTFAARIDKAALGAIPCAVTRLRADAVGSKFRAR
jgi:hypothetical protein